MTKWSAALVRAANFFFSRFPVTGLNFLTTVPYVHDIAIFHDVFLAFQS
jgi:hypothetical protein